MIDTVWLTTSEFGIKADNKFEKTSHVKRSGECSEKAFLNFSDGKRNKDLEKEMFKESIPTEGSITVHDFYGRPNCLLIVSLPKLLYGHSLAEIVPADYEQCINSMHRQLTFAGVDIDLDQVPKMTVSRGDYCRNIQVDSNIADYVYMLASCGMRHAEPDHLKEKGTCLWKNKSWQFTAYNKIKQIKDEKDQKQIHQLYKAGMPIKNLPENVLRFEYRIFRSANVQRILNKRKTFADCFDIDLSRKVLLNKFDSLKVDIEAQQKINSSQLAQLFADFGHIQVQKRIAMEVILNSVNFDLDLLERYLSARYSERQVRYIRRDYEKFIDSMRPAVQRDLFAEMRQKLAA